MKNFLFILFCFFSFSTFAKDEFGYISCSSTNIGDDIQTIAAKKFLPKNSIPIDREFISEFKNISIVSTVINGWYMHTKTLTWQRNDIAPPENSWPPSSSIDPLFISIYFRPAFLPTALSEEGIEYLRKHAPIGTRDYSTLEKLQQKGVSSYFSGCLTLTLDNPYKNTKRENIIYAVDISKDCLRCLKSRTNSEVIVQSHGIPVEIFLENNNEKRLKYAEEVLNKYRKAKCIVTERLHAAMPCLAIETPVLLISQKKDGRLHGLRELTHNCTKKEFLRGEFDFNFDRPPKNSNYYLPIRENLIKIMNEWVNSKKREY